MIGDTNKVERRSISRILSFRLHETDGEAIISLMRPTRRVALRQGRATPNATYLVLHRAGFVVPRRLLERAVVSYTTVSPFPDSTCWAGLFVFCDTVRSQGIWPLRPPLPPDPGVAGRRALWCSDFPPRSTRWARRLP